LTDHLNLCLNLKTQTQKYKSFPRPKTSFMIFCVSHLTLKAITIQHKSVLRFLDHLSDGW
jgi:hypothetical protein